MKEKFLRIPIEKLYLAILIFLGISYMIFMPLLGGPDEYRHFNRAYDVAEGKIFLQELAPKGSEVFVDGDVSYSLVWENRGLSVEPEEAIPNAVATGYSPLTYLPASLGLAIARLFTKNLMILVAVARLSSFAFSAFVLYHAVRKMPWGRNILIATSLMPMTLQQITTVSADSLVIVLSLYVFAFVFEKIEIYREKPETAPMRWWEILEIFLIAVLLGQCKFIYCFLIGVYLLLPKEAFGGARRKWICAAGVFTVTVVTMALWLFGTGAVGVGGGSTTVGLEAGEAASVEASTAAVGAGTSAEAAEVTEAAVTGTDSAGLLASLKGIWIVVYGTVHAWYRLWIASSTAACLGAFNINASKPLLMAFAIVMGYVIVADKKATKELTPLRCLLFFAIDLAVIAGLFFTFWRYYDPKVGSIRGMQGRYFIPLFAPTALGLQIVMKKLPFPEISNRLLAVGLWVLNLPMLVVIFRACSG